MKGRTATKGMELQEKAAQNDYRKSLCKDPTVNRCLLVLDLKPLRS